jgi:protein phosphatase
VYFATDVGKVRSHQEDSGFALPSLLGVFDGMGGMEGGEIASAIASQEVLGVAAPLKLAADDGARRRILRGALTQADQRIGQTLRRRGGTTAVVAAIGKDGVATVGHIGDSRAYLFRSGDLRRLTLDHSLSRHTLARALAGSHDEVDFMGVQLLPGDLLMLCSDGLNDEVTDDMISQVLAENPADPAQALVQAALRTNANDNVTVAVYRHQG